MREHDIPDRRATDVQRGSGRGRTGASQSQPQEHDPVDEIQEFQDEQARRAPDLAGEEVVMTARGSSAAHHHEGDAPGPAGKRAVGSGLEGVAQEHKRQRQSTLDEVYDLDGQVAFRDTFLQWAYDSGIPFAAFRRQSWYRHKKALAAMSRGVWPVYPSFKDIGGGGIDDQRGKVAVMLREVRGSFESVGATILSDARQSRDARPIVNFLAAAKRGALLYATVQRDGSVAETTRIVLRRWKAIFQSFAPKDVLAICTDSASNYMSAAKLLAKDPDPEIRRITWLPCATHVANLMISDIGTRVPWVTETIIRARALVRFIKSHSAAYHLSRVKSRRRMFVHPVETRFASVFFMFVCLLARRNALESMLHDDEWDKIPWDSSKRRQALWVRQVIRCADFWPNVQHAISVMTPVYQLLRRLDRGGMIMSMIYSWSEELVRQVAVVDVLDDMRWPCVEAVQIRTMHMLEPAHDAAHLFNPRRRSLRYYESARRTAADLEVVTECDSFFLTQTGGDSTGDAYLRVHEQMRSFHANVGHMTDMLTRDAKVEAYAGDEETSRCASWWVEHGACFPDLQEIARRVMHMWTSASPAERNWAEHERIHTAKRNKLKFRKFAQLVEIATNLKLLGCSDLSGGAPSATEGLRRSLRLQMQVDSSTGVRREVSGHLDDITADEHMSSQHTPASAPPGDREQTDLRTSDFPGLGHGLSDTGFPGWGHRGERVGDDVEYRPTEAGVPKSTEELHALLDREEEQRLEVLQRDWAGIVVYMAEQQRVRDLEIGAAVPDPGGVEHRDPFAPDLAQTEGHGDPTVPEHGDPAVSNVVLGFRAADTLQPDDVRTEEAVCMEGNSDEHGDGGCGPGVEANDGADTVGRLSPSPSAGPGMEDPIRRGAAGSLGVGVRSPPLYTLVTPRYSGSPASLEREQHHSESIIAAGRGAHRAGTKSLTPPPPTVPHNTPTPVTGRAAGRGHMPTSSSPRLDTQQSFHRPWSTVRRVDDKVRGDFAAHQTRLREDLEEHRPIPSLTNAYCILDQPGHGTRRVMLLGSRRDAPAFYTFGEDGVSAPHGERHHSSINELEARIAREEARLRESHEKLDRERRRMAAARTSDADTEEEPIEVARRRERERERERLVAAQAHMASPTRGRGGRGDKAVEAAEATEAVKAGGVIA
ncbi:hypothetical protein CBR_g48141 [Chara braunii]|uniref:DUF659 domain-containing protein n=1 Tax=Chara braunii TaxID=69332 RepID=A0A388M228_CHABU|nr:hypothetical protein CBR_g48141 [Chara braunii]|eukprot:GBG88611.1 hypothetical protein CBR_g48141 [Chara braunii]